MSETLRIDIRADVKAATASLTRLQREQVPFALAKSLTLTAKEAEANVRGDMGRVFDRPTPFTLNSLRTKSATKQKPTAAVLVKDEATKAIPPIKWLAPQIYGGSRSLKRFERALQAKGILPVGMYAMPTRFMPVDAYGNPSRGALIKILSQLQTFGEQGYRANETAKARRSRNRRAWTGRYFAASRNRSRTKHLPEGIYERIGAGLAIRPVLVFTRSPMYSKRLPFFETVQQTIRASWRPQFEFALQDALRTAQARNRAA